MVNCSTNGTCILNKTGDNTTDNQLQQSIAQYNIPLISDEEKLFLMSLFIIIFVLGVTGNAVVCWVIGKYGISLHILLCLTISSSHLLA